MNIQRQYSQPNCTLVLEGLEDSAEDKVDILEGRSPMSILINAECNFVNSNQQLSGGSVFLENLAKTVSNYAQGLLSGLPHPPETTTEYPRIQIEAITERHLHRLTFEPEPNSGEEKKEIELTTVELFDLVDILDQVYGDRTTLPHLSLPLHSIGKRYRKPEQPLAQRVKPAAVGFASLAIAAGIFYLIPPPELRKPQAEVETTPTETLPTTPPTSPPGNNSENKPNTSEGNK
jgi:hypothetical protein